MEEFPEGGAVVQASSRKWPVALPIALMCIGPPTSLPAQSRTPQVLVLKDPTPREPDLEKKFAVKTPPGALEPARLAAYNQQRFKLIGQASVQMHSLATVLEASLERQQDATVVSEEARLAETIETLAGNVHAALSISPAQHPAKTPKGPSSATSEDERKSAAQSEAKQLLARTEDLQAEVNKSSADTLAVGVLLKSAQVKELADTLRQHLRPGEPPQHP